MRIVGGALGGRRFDAPRGSATRPTSERVREALASALESRDAIAGAQVIDLFAGSGALAFEALSRGARSALLVDRDRRVLGGIAASAETLGLSERVRTASVDLLRAPDRAAARIEAEAGTLAPFDLLFADPPWAEIEALPPLLEALLARHLVAPDALLVLEHGARTPVPDLPGLATEATYRYGDTAVLLAVPARGRAGREAP